jgi:hypothetical protein|tara:strand:+ start:10252 stop:10497 length:246 start_codon:yes stop_codon:yes gene_type:complete
VTTFPIIITATLSRNTFVVASLITFVFPYLAHRFPQSLSPLRPREQPRGGCFGVEVALIVERKVSVWYIAMYWTMYGKQSP